MAKPDPYTPGLEEGWFKVSYGMLPLLLCARFRMDAAVVLCEVLAQVYGRAKRPFATLDVPGIAARWGMQRTNVWRGIADLKKSGVGSEVDGESNRIKFHKRALIALLPPNIAQGTANFPMIVKLYDRDDTPDSTVSTVDTASEDADWSTVSTVDTQTVSTVDTQTVSTVDTVFVPPHTPLYGKEIEIERRVVVVVGADEASSESNQDQIKATRDRIVKLAESLAPMEGSGSKVDGWLAGYPPEWVEQAVLTAMSATLKPGKTWAFINKCLINWKAKGGPADPAAPAPAVRAGGAADVPLSPSQRRQAALVASARDAADITEVSFGL